MRGKLVRGLAFLLLGPRLLTENVLYKRALYRRRCANCGNTNEIKQQALLPTCGNTVENFCRMYLGQIASVGVVTENNAVWTLSNEYYSDSIVFADKSHVCRSTKLVAVAAQVAVTACAAVASNNDGRTLPKVNRLGDYPVHNPEAQMTAPEIIRYYNYPVELHNVTTEDGYILQMHRIPFGQANTTGVRRPPVLLIHGITCSSACLIMNPPRESLPFLMADAGFDVWLANTRGNSYSNRHVKFAFDSDEFWQFSWDEMGYYDLPAMIDAILNATGEEKLVVAGHSQGGTVIYAGLSQRPEYQKKVKLIVALAPVVYLNHMRSPFLLFLRHFEPAILEFYKHFGKREFSPKSWESVMYATVFCANPLVRPLCENMIFVITGYDSAGFNQSRIDVYLGQHDGASTRDMIHFVQASNEKQFQQFDFGSWQENYKHYNSFVPRRYPLETIQTPSAIYYASNDYLASVADIKTLKNQLSNVTEYFLVADDKFQHLDFMMGWQARQYVYDPLIEYVKKNFW